MEREFLQRVFPDDRALGEAIAREVRAVLEGNPEATISLAAGTSSLPAFRALLEKIRAGEISFARARFFAMDEWLDIPREREGSMYDFLTRNFLSQAGFREAFLFDGTAEPEKEILRAREFLGERPLDYILFGIGVNGHVALNEPGCPEDGSIRVVEVSPTTAKVGQKYFGGSGATLQRGITLGMREAMQAGKVTLVANSPEKREIIRSIFDSPSTQSLPATLLKRRGDVEFLLTQAATDSPAC